MGLPVRTKLEHFKLRHYRVMEFLDWIKCGEDGSRFCPLETVDLSDQDYLGVYIIWHNTTGLVLYIGQGNIMQRLAAHRSDPDVLKHRGSGVLLATWAYVGERDKREYIERFLHRRLTPLLSSVSDGPMLEVLLPS